MICNDEIAEVSKIDYRYDKEAVTHLVDEIIKLSDARTKCETYSEGDKITKSIDMLVGRSEIELTTLMVIK